MVLFSVILLSGCIMHVHLFEKHYHPAPLAETEVRAGRTDETEKPADDIARLEEGIEDALRLTP